MTDWSEDDLPTAEELLFGTNHRRVEAVSLEAGELRGEFVGGVLRYLSFGDAEVARRIMVAVRDAAWNTVPPELSNLVIENAEGQFLVSFDARHRSGDLDFSWHGEISGSSGGSCVFSMDGVANSAFDFHRIGLCILHPIREFAGQPYSAGTASASWKGRLPELVAPPEMSAGVYVPLVPGFEWLSLSSRQLRVRFSCRGDLFEIEDQRNWTDASFKSYSRFPVPNEVPERAQVGMRVTQSVSIEAEGPGTSDSHAGQGLQLLVGERLHMGLPLTGIACSPDLRDPPRLTEQLAELNPAHLRVDLHLGEQWETALKSAVKQASLFRCPLELAVFLSDTPNSTLELLASALSDTPMARILIYSQGLPTTSAQDLASARAVFAEACPEIPVGGGSDLNFAELNQYRPELTDIDVVAFPITPQVHASDESSMVETPEAVRAVLETAHSFCDPRAIVVSPISLRPRYNPDSKEDDEGDNVDPRQRSLFAAVWTLATMKALAEAGTTSTTWYETVGERGLAMEARLRGELGGAGRAAVFPIYHVLRDFTELREATLLACTSNDSLKVEAIALASDRQTSLLIANMQPIAQMVELSFDPATSFGEALIRRLNTESAPAAMFDPDRFHRARSSTCANLGALELLPYEYTRVDLA